LANKATPPARWKRLQPSDRKADILTVARRHFANQPYDAVSTAQIADELGINRGLLYHYFGTKRELYLEVIRTTVHAPKFPSIPQLIESGRFEDVLDEKVGEWLHEVESDRETFLFAFRFSSYDPDEEAAAIIQASLDDAVEQTLAMGFDDPSQIPAAARGSLRALRSLTQTAVIEWLSVGSLSRDQVQVLLVQMARALWENLPTILASPPVKKRRT
jgi:AcrR family transcriptional regulator